MKNSSIVVLDIGGTKINIGRFSGDIICCSQKHVFESGASNEQIFSFITSLIDGVLTDDVTAISIGVPSIVDTEQGLVFDAVNIQAWQKEPLKTKLGQHYGLPVYINNDVNCFTFGEYVSGKSDQNEDIVGLCLGTGFGAGMVLKSQLYTGHNCCAGELGAIKYLNSTIDDYCSGQFFKHQYNACGAELAVQARSGSESAKAIFTEFGVHLAAAISQILLIIDPQKIVIGGSVAQSFDLFIDSVWCHLQDFPYPRVLENLTIEQSSKPDSALIGAAHLYLQSTATQSRLAN